MDAKKEPKKEKKEKSLFTLATTAHNKKIKEKEKLALKEQNEALLKQLEMYRQKEENSQSMHIFCLY